MIKLSLGEDGRQLEPGEAEDATEMSVDKLRRGGETDGDAEGLRANLCVCVQGGSGGVGGCAPHA